LGLTEEQRRIVEAPEAVVTVTAYAGTGKTSTLKALAAARPRERILYLAFNRALADESRLAFQALRNVEVRTIHSLAWNHVGRKFAELGNLRGLDLMPHLDKAGLGEPSDRYALARIALDALGDWMISNREDLPGFLKEREKAISIRLAESLPDGRPRRRGGRRPTAKAMAKVVAKIWNECLEGRLRMPHNGYLKLYQLLGEGLLDRYDRVLVDEAQDLNDCMIALIMANRSRKVLVGDPYQQIYGFNGAVNALAKAAADGAAAYHLTQSFRCPNPVAALADRYLRVMGAPKTFKGLAAPPEKPGAAGDLVIGRTNAGLFDFVAEHIDQSRFFYIGGFDGYEFETILDAVSLLLNDPGRIRTPFMRNFHDAAQLEEYADRSGDVALSTRIRIAKRYMAKAFALYRQMREKTAPDDAQADYVATTAHKIKGREYRSVTLLGDFISLSDVIAKGRAVLKQRQLGGAPAEPCRMSLEEVRLVYVSITRSFNRLHVGPEYLATDAMVDELKDLIEAGCVEVWG
jgi:superfamily I DNA/RNA helicase